MKCLFKHNYEFGTILGFTHRENSITKEQQALLQCRNCGNIKHIPVRKPTTEEEANEIINFVDKEMVKYDLQKS